MNLYTTLDLIGKHCLCARSYRKLCRALGEDWEADKKIPLVRILDANGLADALWALRAVLDSQKEERNRICRLMAADFAEHVRPIFEKINGRAASYAADAIYTAHAETDGALVAGRTATYAVYAAAHNEAANFRAAANYHVSLGAAEDAGHAVGFEAERNWQEEVFRKYLESA